MCVTCTSNGGPKPFLKNKNLDIRLHCYRNCFLPTSGGDSGAYEFMAISIITIVLLGISLLANFSQYQISTPAFRFIFLQNIHMNGVAYVW